MIKALFKFDRSISKENSVVVDTTSNSGDFSELSPFILPAPPAKRFENLWQFSKVYPQYADGFNNPVPDYYKWRDKGWADERAHRYPMGKDTKPLYSLWKSERLNYIEARKQIYAPEYAKNVIKTVSYKRLKDLYLRCCANDKELILLDYDAYDHIALNMTLVDVINNPRRKMGHAFVLIMMLTGMFEECLADKGRGLEDDKANRLIQRAKGNDTRQQALRRGGEPDTLPGKV